MRILALIVFGILAALLFFPTLAWTVAAMDWVVSGDNGKDVWRPGFFGLAFLGYVSGFTWWNIKSDKNWPKKTKRVVVEYVDTDGNPVEVSK